MGRTLRLDHYQFKGRYDYFLLNLKAGQTLTLTLAAGTQGIQVQPDNTFIETSAPHAGLQLRDGQGNLLGDLEVVREVNAQKTLEADVSTPQRFYVLVGSPYEGTHKDQFVFRADIQNNFDGVSGRDAGSTFKTAVPLKLGVNDPENFLTKNDDADYFRIPASTGQRLRLQIVPENSKTRLMATLYNEAGQELSRARSLKPGTGATLEAEAASPAVYLRVYRDVGDEPTKYAIFFPEELPAVERSIVGPQVDYRPKFLKSHP